MEENGPAAYTSPALRFRELCAVNGASKMCTVSLCGLVLVMDSADLKHLTLLYWLTASAVTTVGFGFDDAGVCVDSAFALTSLYFVVLVTATLV